MKNGIQGGLPVPARLKLQVSPDATIISDCYDCPSPPGATPIPGDLILRPL